MPIQASPRFIAQTMSASRGANGLYDPRRFTAHLIRSARAADTGDLAFDQALHALQTNADILTPLPGITVTTNVVLTFQGEADAAFVAAHEADIAARKQTVDTFFAAVAPAIGLLATGAPPVAIAGAVLPAVTSLLIGLAGRDNVDLSGIDALAGLLPRA